MVNSIPNIFHQISSPSLHGSMRAIICSTRSVALLLHRSRGVPRISVAYLKSARYSSVSSGCTDETITLPVGNNGAITLQLTRPSALSQSSQGRSPRPNVILYLPPGRLFQEIGTDVSKGHEHLVLENDSKWTSDIHSLACTASPQHVLASTLSAVVVTVNYRLGETETPVPSYSGLNTSSDKLIKDPGQSSGSANSQFTVYKYPTPIHDTLAGFDWIQTHLKPARLAICGTHIGGSLALMLALTEAQSIQAVAATEPVCDWPGLDEYCTHACPSQIQEIDEEDASHGIKSATKIKITSKNKRQPRKKTSAPPDLVPLLQARSRFFSSPERCFDSFASPILFLRSAGRDVPPTFPQYLTGPNYPVPVLKTRGKATAEPYSAPESSTWDQDVYPDMDADDFEGIGAPVTRRRKALSRWPPYGLDYGLSGKTWSGPNDGIGRLEVKLPLVQVLLRETDASFPSESAPSSTVALKRKPKESLSVSTVLSKQAEEMVSVMRRACFWGREKGVGERRVTLARVRGADNNTRQVGDWLKNIFQGSMDDID